MEDCLDQLLNLDMSGLVAQMFNTKETFGLSQEGKTCVAIFDDLVTRQAIT